MTFDSYTKNRLPTGRKAAPMVRLYLSAILRTSVRLNRQLATSGADATALVIGTGSTGASIAYHLAKVGFKNVVLLHRHKVDAKRLVEPNMFSSHHNNTYFKRLCAYSVDFYMQLANEKGLHLNQPGSLRLSTDKLRDDELRYQLSLDVFNPPKVQLLKDGDEVASKHKLLDSNAIHSGLFAPEDGWLSNADLTKVLIGAARSSGVVVHEDCPVHATKFNEGKWEVDTPKGKIRTTFLVNAAGIWARDIARQAGITIDLVHVDHPFIITGDVNGVSQSLPILYHLESGYYIRPEGSGLLMGCVQAFDEVQQHRDWYYDGVPADADDSPTQTDSKIRPKLEMAYDIMPSLKKVDSITSYLHCWPVTLDSLPLLGPIARMPNYWMAAGILDEAMVAGGIGQYLAQYMFDGEQPYELNAVEPNRFDGWTQRYRNFVFDKTREAYSRLYGNSYHHPPRSVRIAPVKVSGIYGGLVQQGAVMQYRYGWESCEYFKSKDPSEDNYKSIINRECEIVMNRCAILDLSNYGRVEVKGPDAEKFVNFVFTRDLPDVGHTCVVYALTPKGKIFTRVRMLHHEGGMRESTVLLMIRPEEEHRNYRYLHSLAAKHGFSVQLNNVSEYLGCLCVVGPTSRDMLQELTRDKLSDEKFPHGTVRLVRLGSIPVIACRETTIGELGWQLYHNRADSLRLYETIMKVGGQMKVKNIGRLAFNALRVEKGFKFSGHELTLDTTPFEALIDDEIITEKRDFVGLSAFKELKNKPLSKKLVQLLLHDEDIDHRPLEHMPQGLESISGLDGKIVGYTTSGCFAYTAQKPIVFAYVPPTANSGDHLRVNVVGQIVDAKVMAKAALQPSHLRPT